jgi:hypothetical protein
MPYRSSDISPESDVKPYESLDERQMAISGERFPEHLLIVCDSCYWCSTCFNMRGLIDACPNCHKEVSKIPLTIDENSDISYDTQKGLTIRFSRKLPFR